jgi:bacteriorhodopsin
MRDVWVETGATPLVYRYIDWLITVPLLMVEFYLILRAITAVSGGVFWRLMIGSIVMLAAGYMGEAGIISPILGFVVGIVGWAYILYEIFYGEAGKVAAEKAPASVQSAFSTMRWIVTIGWAIYPLGYFMGYFAGLDSASATEWLNIIYNLADVLNKIAFGVIIWNVAVTESDKASK